MVVALGVGGEGDDGGGAAVEVFGEDDDLGLVGGHFLDQVAPFAHGLDGGLHRLRAGVHGQDHLLAGQFGQFFGEQGPAVVEERPRGEGQDVGLVLQRLDDRRVAVALVDGGVGDSMSI